MSDPITVTQTICDACRRGQHNHSRWTNTGADAGCPYLTEPGNLGRDCACTVVVPPIPPGRCPTCGRPS